MDDDTRDGAQHEPSRDKVLKLKKLLDSEDFKQVIEDEDLACAVILAGFDLDRVDRAVALLIHVGFERGREERRMNKAEANR